MAIAYRSKGLGTEIKDLPEYFPVAAFDQSIQLFRADKEIDHRKNKIDSQEKKKDNGNKFPQRKVKHIMEDAEPFPKGIPSFTRL